jgi:hypothetical protein
MVTPLQTTIGNATQPVYSTLQQSRIESTGAAPKNDRESAPLVTLVPGSYTAIARGKNNSTGVALIEAYNLE